MAARSLARYGSCRGVKAAGLGQEVGGVTLVTAGFRGIKGCLQTALAVGGFSDPPAVAGKGSGHAEGADLRADRAEGSGA